MLLALALAMSLPILVDLAGERSEWPAFTLALLAVGFLGGALVLSAASGRRLRLRGREAFLATLLAWVGCAVAGAIPLAFGSLHLSATDSLFESMSGLTDTGATVIRGLAERPAAVLVWRAELNWLGGIAVIMTALLILPAMRIGGMQLFAVEAAEDERPGRRLSDLVRGTLAVYVLFTLLIGIGYRLAGLPAFDAACNAMSTISTGGFATNDHSFGMYGSAARLICVVGMIVGGGTFALYVAPWRHGEWRILHDRQIRWYLGAILAFTLFLGGWNWLANGVAPGRAAVDALFNSTAVISTSGFDTNDYDSWGGASQVAFFLMAVVGGCTGSTAGGLKFFRVQVLWAMASVQMRRLIHPHGVFMIEHQGHPLPAGVLRSVLGFVTIYLIAIAMLALGLALAGMDAVGSLSGAVAAMANVAHGLGSVIGPYGDYQEVPTPAKWLLALGMLTGRLEVAPVLILFTRSFWRR